MMMFFRDNTYFRFRKNIKKLSFELDIKSSSKDVEKLGNGLKDAMSKGGKGDMGE